MLRRIGSCRKNVMAISRLLMNKADVVRGLMKRFDERFAVATAAIAASKDPHVQAGPAGGILPLSAAPPVAPSPAPAPTIVPSDSVTGMTGAAGSPVQATIRTSISDQSTKATTHGTPAAAPVPISISASPSFIQYQPQEQQHQQHQQQQPYRDGEILLYLGDILDHVLTMLQSLNSYEKILSRSHSNYLAQISLEINQLSNKTNEVVGTLTFFASLIVPMTFVAGLWG